ncbi:TetR/AcrR family transcriptional regulator [Actinokineospora auranticolor]|uniref:AcrR family transcriptional regulator n=1 Tax=Actinokineospora auranticolor TaxID=155976 RepID=A0A2S6GBW5_9PSEU|nr:TetR/AcrR family transcriptional regulator [Actinokineospora auranticolor]PPK61857.1 AcrR family transcriptional regulator [Actinokineospora auranticolor]
MPGRPRDPALDAAILRATFEFVEEEGYRRLSIEGIAARSGVHKQAIYRRYRSKGELVLAALGRFAAERLPTPDTGSLRDDLVTLLTATFAAQRGASGQLNRALAVEALQDERFAARLWTELIEPRRAVVRAMIDRAAERGEITGANPDFFVDLVYGPMWYRLLFDIPALDDSYAARLADTVLAAARGPRTA